MKRQYEHLASFLRSWFHQDFDISGNTVEEIVSAFKKISRRAEVNNVRLDIKNFLEDCGNALDYEFDKTFDLDIDPTGFSPTVKDFLETIHESLGEPATP